MGANTIIKPGLQSSVVRVEGTNKAIASTIDGEARYVFNQPYEGGKMVVAEAYRNLIAVGATPLHDRLLELWISREKFINN